VIGLSDTVRERYRPYPTKKEKKGIGFEEGQFLKRTYEWLKWKLIQRGDSWFHKPYLEK